MPIITLIKLISLIACLHKILIIIINLYTSIVKPNIIRLHILDQNTKVWVIEYYLHGILAGLEFMTYRVYISIHDQQSK